MNVYDVRLAQHTHKPKYIAARNMGEAEAIARDIYMTRSRVVSVRLLDELHEAPVDAPPEQPAG